MRPSEYERVYTVTEFYDGPRQGIAELNGVPHVYACEWDEEEGVYADTFLLSPVQQDILTLALEDWSIWLRWETAFKEGRATEDTHPALPEDRTRHEELAHALRRALKVDRGAAVRARGDFRNVGGTTGWDSLRVRWMVLGTSL